MAGARRSAEAALHDRQLGQAYHAVVVEVHSAAAADGGFAKALLGPADVQHAHDAVVVEVPVAVVGAPIVVRVADLPGEIAGKGDLREVKVERRAGVVRCEHLDLGGSSERIYPDEIVEPVGVEVPPEGELVP